MWFCQIFQLSLQIDITRVVIFLIGSLGKIPFLRALTSKCDYIYLGFLLKLIHENYSTRDYEKLHLILVLGIKFRYQTFSSTSYGLNFLFLLNICFCFLIFFQLFENLVWDVLILLTLSLPTVFFYSVPPFTHEFANFFFIKNNLWHPNVLGYVAF